MKLQSYEDLDEIGNIVAIFVPLLSNFNEL